MKQLALPAVASPQQMVAAAPAPVAASQGASADLAQLQLVGMVQQLIGRFEQFERSAAGDERRAGYRTHTD